MRAPASRNRRESRVNRRHRTRTKGTDEKTDPNPEIGEQPLEKGEAESESAGVEAQGSETDSETPVGTEKPDRANENDDFLAFSKQKLKENIAEK